jgi:hypothetical protein
MTGPRSSPLKCLPTATPHRPHPARYADGTAAVGGSKDAARRAPFQPVALTVTRTAHVPEGRGIS